MNEKIFPPPFFPLHAALFEASLVLLAVLFGWLLGQSPLESLRLSVRGIVLGIVAVVPLAGLLVGCEHLPWRPVREVRRVLDDLVVPLFRNCSWSELAAISLLAGVGEEMLFRGVLQAAMAEWTGNFLPHSPAGAALGDWMAIVTVAIVFGLLHALNTAYAVLAALMGVYLGWLWMATGNLVVPIVAHGLYDFLALRYLLHRRRAAVGPQIPLYIGYTACTFPRGGLLHTSPDFGKQTNYTLSPSLRVAVAALQAGGWPSGTILPGSGMRLAE